MKKSEYLNLIEQNKYEPSFLKFSKLELKNETENSRLDTVQKSENVQRKLQFQDQYDVPLEEQQNAKRKTKSASVEKGPPKS